MLILAIDPGSTTHGYVLYDPSPGGEHGPHVIAASKDATTAELEQAMSALWVEQKHWQCVIERVTAQQYAANSLLRTAEWGGYLYKEAEANGGGPVWMTRQQVLSELHIHGASRDKQVREKMIEMHGGSKEAAVGRKASQGPLYGVSSHAWQALGLGVAWWLRYAREGL